MSFSELVTGFISRNPAMLDPPRVYNPSSIQPSRRTWEDLSKSIGLMGNDINSVLLYEVAVGYVGSEVAVSFNDYVRTVSSALTAEDVVKSRVTDPDVYRQLSASEQNALIEEVARVIRGEKSLPKIAETGMRAFFLSLPGELRVSLWSKLVSGGLAEEKLILDVHRVCSKYVTEVFSTPKE